MISYLQSFLSSLLILYFEFNWNGKALIYSPRLCYTKDQCDHEQTLLEEKTIQLKTTPSLTFPTVLSNCHDLKPLAVYAGIIIKRLHG